MTGTPCPKPTPRPKKAKRPMQRKSRLQARKPFRSKSSADGLTPVARKPWSRGGERDGAAAMPISGRRTTPPKRGPNRVSARVKAEVVTGGERPAFPKPEKKPKRRHWGVSRGPSKTAYARRARELGRMAFVRSLPCCCTRTYLIGRGFGPCSGRMHAHHAGVRGLGVKAPDNTCVPLCEGHHRAYHDGLGAFGVATKAEARGWMDRRIAETRAAWDSLADAERTRWNEMAATRRTA